ncbi:MAG: DUF1345 domain-containing protein, partial [Methyloceanibacter sp.]
MATAKKATTSKQRHSLYEHVNAHIRLIIAVIVGFVVWWLLPLNDNITRILAAWNVAGWLYVVLIGIMMLRCEIAGIKRQASLEDESRTVLLILTVFASVAMVLAIVAQLSALNEDHSADRTLKFGLAFSTILVS